jgi:hypothetical protein
MPRHGLLHHFGRAQLVVAAAVAMSTVGSPLGAQSAGKGFLFQEPRWTLSVRGGIDRPNAGSDIFEFVTTELTLDRSDFVGFNVGADLAYSLRPRLDLTFSAGYARSSDPSESAKYLGTDDLPILQTTTFSRLPLTVGLKAYILPRGEAIGSLAWIPSRFSPFVGAGGGAMHFTFEQEGEWVDEQTDPMEIFNDALRADGWAPTAHVLGGFDFALSPRWGVTTEARYTWGRGVLGQDFDDDYQGWHRIDLSGLSATMGLHVRF